MLKNLFRSIEIKIIQLIYYISATILGSSPSAILLMNLTLLSLLTAGRYASLKLLDQVQYNQHEEKKGVIMENKYWISAAIETLWALAISNGVKATQWLCIQK